MSNQAQPLTLASLPVSTHSRTQFDSEATGCLAGSASRAGLRHLRHGLPTLRQQNCSGLAPGILENVVGGIDTR